MTDKKVVPKGECRICGREMALRAGGACSWCDDQLRAGKTVEQIEERFLTSPPVRGFRPKTLQDVAKESERLNNGISRHEKSRVGHFSGGSCRHLIFTKLEPTIKRPFTQK